MTRGDFRVAFRLFQSESKCEAFHMEISFILHVNKTNFHMKGFALGLALKQRRKATRKSPVQFTFCLLCFSVQNKTKFKLPSVIRKTIPGGYAHREPVYLRVVTPLGFSFNLVIMSVLALSDGGLVEINTSLSSPLRICLLTL